MTPPPPDAVGPCPHLASCPMFPLFSMQSALEIWKISYCQATFTSCARYERSVRGESVPANLMPNGVLLRRHGTPG